MIDYERHVGFRFSAGPWLEWMEISGYQEENGQGFTCIEELRKNGQEDCHMTGVLLKKEDGWKWDMSESESFETYGSSELMDAIMKYLNENPPPLAES